MVIRIALPSRYSARFGARRGRAQYACMIEKRPFRYFLNRNHGVPGIAVLPETGYARAKAEIMTWPGYAPTPLVVLD
jgi:hypothetical protein